MFRTMGFGLDVGSSNFWLSVGLPWVVLSGLCEFVVPGSAVGTVREPEP